MQTAQRDWVQTRSGKKFFPLRPEAESIDITDIAHSLSMQCRFTGHTKFHYSVAQHSIYLSWLVPDDLKLAALLHDASEAYLIDLCSPLKQSPGFEIYSRIERLVMKEIAQKYGFTWPLNARIKEAENRLFADEATSLMAPLHPDFEIKGKPFGIHILEITPSTARRMFLSEYAKLAA